MRLSNKGKYYVDAVKLHFSRFIIQSLAVAEMDVRKLWHDPSEMIARSFQPVIWLLFFGEVLAHAHIATDQNIPYLTYIVPGILAQSILFVAIFHGIAVIWERDLGLVQKFLVSPAPRIALVLGKSLSGGLRALPQVIVVCLLALFLGAQLNYTVISLLGVIVFTLLGAGIFATFSLIIACIVKTRERFMGIGQLIIMPLFFASNAIYPISIMPTWIKVIAHLNPLTYEVDALRMLMLGANTSLYGMAVNFLVLLFIFIAMLIIGARLYPQLAR